jgi:hypothetical protein
VALVRTDVSEEPGASFIRVTKIGELGTTQAATSKYLPADTFLSSHQLKKFPTFLEEKMFSSVLTTALHWSLFSAHTTSATIYQPYTYVLVFLLISFLLAFPPIFYKKLSSLPSG